MTQQSKELLDPVRDAIRLEHWLFLREPKQQARPNSTAIWKPVPTPYKDCWSYTRRILLCRSARHAVLQSLLETD